MKNFFGLLLASTLVLGACGNSSNDSKENKTESVNENKLQFKNDTLVINDAVLKIKDTFIVKDTMSGDKLLAFKYEVKNKTDKEEITAFNVWLATMKATQDSDSTVNELEVGMTPNTGKYEEWSKHSDDQIKKGKTAKGIITYTLQNDEDVTLKATKGVDGKDLGSKKIKIGDLKTVEYDAASDLTKSNPNSDETQQQKSTSEGSSDVASANTSETKQETKQTTDNIKQDNSTQSQSNNDNSQMSEAEIDEWNQNKPTTHDESQIEGVGGHPSAFGKSSDVPVGVEKQDSSGETYIDATGE